MAGGASFGIDAGRVRELACEVAAVVQAGIETGVVAGGGNFFRGVAAAAKKMAASRPATWACSRP